MPMLKTASTGVTSITGIQTYLLREQRQEHEQHQREWDRYAAGEIQLSERQAGRLQEYLGGASRGLAIDVSEDLPTRFWAQQMDITRAQFGHDRPTAQGASRSYYHFILSPNMEDACDLETIRAYAKAWAEENFRRGGRLHEYAIVPHDDNTRGILHAHIVVNVTNKADGHKLHLDNDEVVGLQLSAQEIGRRFGLTPLREQMQKTVGARTTQPIYLDQKEREILNKGGYSWKWELRKAVMDIAPLASDFDDFKLKLNRAGYDVTRSEKTGYLTYTHRNGVKVKDSRLGARFYFESLQKMFAHESFLEDQSYATWELIKISKGEVPWKEEIRRAVDAVAPTVMSVHELQQELGRLYGVRLIMNRRGITYQHSSGYKTRDVSIGLRYTFEGLRQNAVLGMTLPHPGWGAILQESDTIVRRYLPRSARGVGDDAREEAAARFVYQDVAKLMTREGLVSLDDIAPMLDRRYDALRQEKAELTEMRSQAMRWNHLAVLQSRYERDRAFLLSEGKDADPVLHNEALIRSERLGLYLREQVGTQDIKGSQKALNEAYEARLNRYQEQMDGLEKDKTIYRNYLMSKGLVAPPGEGGSGSQLDTQALLSAGKTLAKHRVRDFYHLGQLVFSHETRFDLAQHKLEKAEERKAELDLIMADIRSYREAGSYLPDSEVLAERPASLNVEAQLIRFKDAAGRLGAMGIDEGAFAKYEEMHESAVSEYCALLKNHDKAQAVLQELKEAQQVCQDVAASLKSPLERNAGEGKKGGSSGVGGTAAARDGLKPQQTYGRTSENPRADASADLLPIEEAKRRRQERLRNAPERSVRRFDDLLR